MQISVRRNLAITCLVAGRVPSQANCCAQPPHRKQVRQNHSRVNSNRTPWAKVAHQVSPQRRPEHDIGCDARDHVAGERVLDHGRGDERAHREDAVGRFAEHVLRQKHNPPHIPISVYRESVALHSSRCLTRLPGSSLVAAIAFTRTHPRISACFAPHCAPHRSSTRTHLRRQT